MEPDILWQSGDPWRDLGPVIAEHDQVTIVSRSGSARHLDLREGRHNRVALEGGHRMDFDTAWRPLEPGPGPRGWTVSITPCGMTLVGGYDWAAGTSLWLVMIGVWAPEPIQPGGRSWTDTAIGREIVDRILRRERPTFGEGHPAEPCGAYYCHFDQRG